ncbi:MAG: TM2 domain-containing protein [Acidocella sp.]|nr:TM2 domain-containing protein [Acidocella sp.]
MNQKAYMMELQTILSSIPDGHRDRFFSSFVERAKNPVVAFGCDGFIGSLGIDRFYIGDTLLGVIKLLTLGGFGIWTFIDLFLIAGRTRDKNIQMARDLKSSFTAIQVG